MSNPIQLTAWKDLEAHHREMAPLQMRDLFRQDSGRFEKFTLRFNDILLDFSKNRITEKTMTLLRELARQANLSDWIEKLFTGQKINTTEDRAELHIALRNR